MSIGCSKMERETTADVVIKQLVADGYAEFETNEAGVPCIRLTEQGQRKADVLMKGISERE